MVILNIQNNMKNFIFLVILVTSLIFFHQCSSSKSREYFDKRYIKLTAKIFKIEVKNNIIVYHFKNKNTYGVFAREKICNLEQKTWENIQINKTYCLLLDLPVTASERFDGYRITINGDFVWESGMESTYYDCLNVCGNKIYSLK